jgi:hypothetical protein
MSFLRVHQTPGLFLLTAHGFAYKSPVFNYILEVDCLLSALTAKGYSNPTLLVPLTDLPCTRSGQLLVLYAENACAVLYVRDPGETSQF